MASGTLAPRRPHRTLALSTVVALVIVIVVSTSAAPTGPTGAVGTDDGFLGVTPHRVLDTREGIGAPATKVGPGESIDVTVVDVGGVPATGVDTIVFNVAVTNPTAERSYVTVWPTGVDRPTAANLNMVAGQTFANLVFAKVGDAGQVSIYNDAGDTHIVADIVGYIPKDAGFVGITPTRVLDTRTDTGEFAGPQGPGSLTLVEAASRGGIPTDGSVQSVVLNVTAVQPTATSYITAFEFGLDRPVAANLNMQPGQTIPNLVVQKVDREGRIWLYNDAGETHLVADLVGYFTRGASYFGLEPTRLLDTRDGTGQNAPKILGPGEEITVDLSQTANLTNGPASVALNITAIRPSERGFFTVWPEGAQPPTASLNFAPNDIMPNMVVTRVGADGKIRIFNSAGSTHATVDLLGWFADTTVNGCQTRIAEASMQPLTTTDHFAAWWGGDVDDVDRLHLAADRALTDMELARNNAVGALGLPEAPGNPHVCANVIIGETGGAFDEAGPGVGTDVDGFPFMVMPLAVIDGFADTPPAANVAGVEYTQHEAFHLFQYDTPFVYGGETTAWIEGTADWFTRYTYPADQGGRYPAAAYLRYSHDPMWSSLESLPDDAVENDTRGAHAYGVSWFFYYLTGYAGVPAQAITEGFSGSDPDPWSVLYASLDRRGFDMARLFGTFTARNATLDWDQIDVDGINDGHNYHDFFDGPDFRIAAEHNATGTNGFTGVPTELIPRGYGWNTIHLAADADGTYRIEFDGEATGNEGTASAFEVHTVIRSGDDRSYTRLTLDADRAGEVEIPAKAGDDVYLVVAAVPDRLGGNEYYDYDYRITRL